MENIIIYLASFQKAAREAKWSQERIDAVSIEVLDKDYEHALIRLRVAVEELRTVKVADQQWVPSSSYTMPSCSPSDL